MTPEDAKALLAKEPERVKGAYQMRIAEYSREEQIRARHMLFTGEDAEAQALKARARLDAGESFADVAKQVSADEATRGEGGELGTFPRGRMMPSFDEVAFALEVGKPSGPVKTDRGVHLILVESHDPARQTPFEEVAEKLAAELLRDDRASEAARNAANQVLEKTSAGEPFVKAAESEKLPVTVTPPFTFKDAQVPGLAGVPDAARGGLRADRRAPGRAPSLRGPGEPLRDRAADARRAERGGRSRRRCRSMREKLQQREREHHDGGLVQRADEGARGRRQGPAVRDRWTVADAERSCYGIAPQVPAAPRCRDERPQVGHFGPAALPFRSPELGRGPRRRSG